MVRIPSGWIGRVSSRWGDNNLDGGASSGWQRYHLDWERIIWMGRVSFGWGEYHLDGEVITGWRVYHLDG
jgi:hypothetical protein